MKIAETARAVVGATLVYVAMAACSASDAGSSAADGGTSQDGALGSILEDGSFVDALVNPVPTAQAAALEEATEQCNKTYSGSGYTFAYAEHLYPGVPANTLAATVVTVAVRTAAAGPFPAGYDRAYAAGGWVRDGAVAFQCGNASTPAYSSVSFVRRTD